tara:strand:+ start:949 stop:1926 length:978 start_codon:yes stop_codon:yes gene_type:complete
MNNLKKIGLTALAGSLVATTSAMAGSLSASGSASVGLTNVTQSQGTTDSLTGVQGNGFSMGNSVTFAGSGDLDNGMSISVSFELDAGAADGTKTPFDSHSLTLGMNEMGSLTFAGHGGSTVMGAWDDKTPNALEEAWDVVDNNAAAADDGGANNSFWYTNTFADSINVYASYVNQASGMAESYSDWGVSYTGVEGLTVGYAEGENKQTAGSYDEQSTTFITYAYGALTVGYQVSDSDVEGGATSDAEALAYSASYAISDDLSVSYSVHEFEYGNTSLTDQESSGISASYTMGSISVSGAMNQTDNVAGESGADEEGYYVTMAFTF